MLISGFLGGTPGLVLGCSCCLKMCALWWFCRFSTSTDVRSCHKRLNIGVFVLLENVRFMVVARSFQSMEGGGGGCQFVENLPFPLVQGMPH